MKVRTVAVVILFFSSVLSGCTGNDSDKDDRIEALEAELSDSISDHDSSLEQIITLEAHWPSLWRHWQLLKGQCLI